KLTLGFSTCPNDTFMFDAMVHKRIDTLGLEFEVEMADILHLNHRALAGEADVIKVSYNTYGHLRERYHLLNAGSAMGKGCGPLLIAERPISLQELQESNAAIAIPGKHTTANLLLSFFAPELRNRKEMLFHEVMPAIQSGEVAAGVIIHENRFTYQEMGLYAIQDLGEYWEGQTGLPIPLGAIVAKKSLGKEVIERLERVMRESVAFAFAHRSAASDFVRCHAQELSSEVTQAHIDLYVNDFSLDMGAEGRRAVARLLAVGEEMGLYV
ncbi:MAG TPA: 1,4-dihydroxy-6-naphthoate synthase, partial [Bacteroidetes bacterium]|nr:1,4-dihydroxy-6-naphthoate synthase [Bacteroidota bacterium]